VLVDNLTRLEERVEGLIGNLDKAIRDNAELRQYNAELEAEVEQIQEKNAALLERVKKAHQEVEEAVGREGVVRDRLQAILERIDTIEDQIHQPQTVE
jgi:chromosome segregation ATPase